MNLVPVFLRVDVIQFPRKKYVPAKRQRWFTLARDDLEVGAKEALRNFNQKEILIRLNPEHPAVLSTQTMDPEALIAAENGGIVPDNPSQDAGIKDQPGQKKMVLDLDAIMVISWGSF